MGVAWDVEETVRLERYIFRDVWLLVADGSLFWVFSCESSIQYFSTPCESCGDREILSFLKFLKSHMFY